MANNWRLCPLDELVDEIVDRRGITPIKLGSDFTRSGYRVISAKLIKNGRVDLDADEPRYVDEVTYRRWMRMPLQEDDVILTSEAPLGETAYVCETLEWCLGQRLFAIRTNKDRLSGRFLYYVLRYEPVSNDLHSRATGTTAQGIRQVELRRVRIPVPPLPEQRAIAHILGTLDDKIELNRRLNQTLEEIARTLFTSWFVNFDPVRDKAAGRQPEGMNTETAALFPDSFVDRGLGEIPRGWSTCSLADFCRTQYGHTTSATEEPVGPRFLRVTDINKRPWIEWQSVPYCAITDVEWEKYRLRSGDIVVARMADPGKSAIVDEEVEAVFASYLVRLTTPSLAHSYYVYGFLSSDLYRAYAEGARSGSVQANMNAKVIVGAKTTIPPEPLLEAHLRLVLPIRKRIAANVRESMTLATIRDALLPKLLSGDVRTPDAHRFIAEVCA